MKSTKVRTHSSDAVASDSRGAMGYSTVTGVTMTQAPTLLTGISQIHISSPLSPSSAARHWPKPAMTDEKKEREKERKNPCHRSSVAHEQRTTFWFADKRLTCDRGLRSS